MSAPDEPASASWPHRLVLVLFVLAAVAVPTAYSLYTEHVWEDFFITFRHSKNLCEGKGLLYNEGERVHGFTSPLGVLLPALCHLATGSSESYLPALWLFRGLCIAAFAAGGVLLLLAVPRDQPFGTAIRVGLGLLYLTEAKSVVYTTNGMETAFMLLFLAWALYLFRRGGASRWLATGVCWAGLMWTRPDSCIYIAALGLGTLIFTAAPRRATFLSLLRSGVVCTLLYLPWFAGAWTYYGSPLPQTVRAKSGYDTEPMPLDEQLQKAWNRYPEVAANMFRPVYYGLGEAGWPSWLQPLTMALGLFASFYWLAAVDDPLGRMASFCFFAVSCYFTGFVTHIYPWYMPPVTLFGLVALASGIVHVGGTVPFWTPLWRGVAVLLLLALVADRALVTGLVSWQMKVQQAEVETGNRRRIGEWLREHVRPGERVYLEPVGYIGYFSGAHILDWPGLVSPEVVRLRKEKKLGRYEYEGYLRPEWIVLRPGEAWHMGQQEYFKDYEAVQAFDVTARVDENAYPVLPGRGYLLFDSQFTVYRRKDLPPLGGN